MKKVLLIGYPFPLRQGGSPRLLGLAKYLPEFGWQPIILTAPLDQKPDQTYRIIETGYRNALGFWMKLFRFNQDEDLRRQVKQRLGVTAKKSILDKVLTFGGEIVNYPDSEKGWKPFAVKPGDKIIRQEGIDVIISTSAPVTVHTIARELKRRHNIPWLADLRDLWSQNHNYSYSRVRRWVDRRLELKTLSAADALTTVSQPWAHELGTLHGGKPTFAITTGFDPDEINVPPARVSDKFTITYTGLIYTGKQDPAKLFAALQELIAENIMAPEDIEVRFYGAGVSWLAEEIEKYRLSAIVKIYDRIPREAAVGKQRESQILFLLDWDNQFEKGVYPVKIFEYLAARRPILATGGSEDNVVAELLKETQAGIQSPTVESVKRALETMYGEFKSRGRVAFCGNESSINKYSHREMARKFSEILDNLVAGRVLGI